MLTADLWSRLNTDGVPLTILDVEVVVINDRTPGVLLFVQPSTVPGVEPFHMLFRCTHDVLLSFVTQADLVLNHIQDHDHEANP
jgi:hypothetical protein